MFEINVTHIKKYAKFEETAGAGVVKYLRTEMYYVKVLASVILFK